MAVTLAQAKLNTQDAIQAGIIDEFAKNSYLLQKMTFDDAVNPSGGGATMTYGYTRLLTQPSAGFRAVNSEYTPGEVTKERKTTDLKILGGSFEIDRVLVGMKGLVDEVNLQLTQKIKATVAQFCDTCINGDVSGDANSFDGLSKAITGTSTEVGTGAVIDLSTSANMDTNYKAALDALDDFLSRLDGRPTALLMNNSLLTKLRGIARRAGYFTQTEDAFGQVVDTYNGIPLIDLGDKPASTDPISGIYTRTVGTSTTGLTDLYAVRLAMDGLHGVTYSGKQMIQTWLPDFTTAGAVKKGEVEMVVTIALKKTKAAGILRNWKVQ